jgi:beta-aspartyl-peptidase (threonine type)
MEPLIIIHGGAWAIPDSFVEASKLGVQMAAKAGWAKLSLGGTSLDAVEAAVSILEDDPVFDAGTGAVLTLDGEVELDAMIMEGKDLRCGAIACVKNIKNPVQLARLVMEKTEHVMLVGKGANDFATENGVKLVVREELVTIEAIKQWEQYKKYKNTVSSLFSERYNNIIYPSRENMYFHIHECNSEMDIMKLSDV